MDRPPSGSDTAADVAIEPLDGYRVWRLRGEGAELRLGAVTRGSIWPALEPMRAACPVHPAEEVPGGDCMCGLYAAGTLRSLVRAGVLQRSTVGVVGAIAMWGRVVEHRRGARSSLAYPARLRLVCGPCLFERRGPVDPHSVVHRDGELVPVCVRHLAPGERGASAAGVQRALLDAYGVELLPAEVALRGLGHRRGVGAVLRRLDAAPRVPERLRTPARVSAAVAAALLLVLGMLALRPAPQDVGSTPASAAAAVPSPPAGGGSRPAGGPPSVAGSRPAAGPSSVAPKRLPSVLCGVVSGGALQHVACREGRADAFGVTSSPPAAPSTCNGEFEWYTRGRSWSVCWFVAPSALDRLRVR